MQLPSTYPPFDHIGEIPEDEEIILLLKSHLEPENSELVACRTSSNLYYNSDYCKKMYCKLPWEEMYDYYGIPKNSDVLILRDIYRDDLLLTNIRDIDHLCRFAHVASQLMLDLEENYETSLETMMSLSGFVIAWQKQSLQTWKDNRKILYNTETKDFDIIHFLGPKKDTEDTEKEKESPGVSPVSNYNFTNSTDKNDKYAKFYGISIDFDKKEHNEMIQNLQDLAKLLPELGLKKLLKDIIIAMLIDFRYCEIPFVVGEVYDFLRKADMSRYIFYAMRILFLEEKCKYTLTHHDDRFLFCMNAINSAVAHLPEYNFDIDHPFFSNLIGKDNFLCKQPVEPCFLLGDRGVYNFDKFQERLRCMTGGILDDLDWNKSALCGSTIAACLIRNPLEQYFSNFSDYIDEYYPGKMLNMKEKKKKRSQIQKYIIDFSPDFSDENDINSLPLSSSEQVGDYVDIDIMIETFGMSDFDEIVQKHFQTIHKNTCRGSAQSRNSINLVKIMTENKYKYRITGLSREVEFFQVNSIPGVIAKFHLGCVRAYYDGKNVKMFPTFITAAYTGLNCDIRWVSCNKDLRDILLKYYQRGFGFLMNMNEKKLMETHMLSSSKWVPMRKARSQSNQYGGWRRRRMERIGSIFCEIVNKMLNPSFSRIGIGYGIQQLSREIKPKFSKNLERLERTGKFKKSKYRTKKGVKTPEIYL
jgi:hypothetical protein